MLILVGVLLRLPFDHEWDDGVSPRVQCSCDVVSSSPVWSPATWGLRKWLKAEAVVPSLSLLLLLLLSLWMLVLLNPRAIQFPSAPTRPHASSTGPRASPPFAGGRGNSCSSTSRKTLKSSTSGETPTSSGLGGREEEAEAEAEGECGDPG